MEMMKRWLDSKDDLNFEKGVFELEKQIEPCRKVRIHDLPSEKGGDLDAIDKADEEEYSISGFKEYRKLICNDPGYIWLLNCLKRDLRLSRAEEDTMHSLGSQIIQASRSAQRISRRKSSTGCKVKFIVGWDAFAFLADQEIDAKDPQSIVNIITVTGSCRDAQALGCREYLAQTWPSTGALLVELVQQALWLAYHDGGVALGT